MSDSIVIERSRVRVPSEASGEFSSPGSSFCADSYFGIRSTRVLPEQHEKDPGHSDKSARGRLQLNTHTPYLCGFEWSDTVNWCMVGWCTQNLRWDGSISRGNSHATTPERYQYTTSLDIINTRYKRMQSLVQNHRRHVCCESAREQRTALYKSYE